MDFLIEENSMKQRTIHKSCKNQYCTSWGATWHLTECRHGRSCFQYYNTSARQQYIHTTLSQQTWTAYHPIQREMTAVTNVDRNFAYQKSTQTSNWSSLSVSLALARATARNTKRRMRQVFLSLCVIAIHYSWKHERSKMVTVLRAGTYILVGEDLLLAMISKNQCTQEPQWGLFWPSVEN